MQHIVSTQIQHACRETWNFTSAELADELRRLQLRQPHLVQLVTDECDVYGAKTTDLGIHMVYLIWRLFDERASAQLHRVTVQHATRDYERSVDILFNLSGVNERLVERLLDPRTSGHPDLMLFIEDMLYDYRDGESKPLSDGELGVMIALARTFIELLDHASRAPVSD